MKEKITEVNVIAEIKRMETYGTDTTIKITRKVFEGAVFYDFRVWYSDYGSTILKPTRKGFVVHESNIEDFKFAVSTINATKTKRRK